MITRIQKSLKLVLAALVITALASCGKAASDQETEDLGVGTTAIVVSGGSPADGAATVQVSTTADGKSTVKFVAENSDDITPDDDSSGDGDDDDDSSSPLLAPGAFSITAPVTPILNPLPKVIWDTSSNVTSYDVIVAKDSSCTDIVESASGVIDTTWDLSVTLADALYYICVSATNSVGTTDATNTGSFSFLVNTSIVAVMTGLPTAISNATSLDVTVDATGIDSYSFKVGSSGSTDCTSNTNYSMDVASSTKITQDISSLAQGDVKLCVVGRHSSGSWQQHSVASSYIWTKDTIAPSVSIDSNTTVRTIYSTEASVSDTNSYTLLWTQESGSGSVTISDNLAEDPTLLPNSDDTYTMRLTATDSAGNSANADFDLTWDTTAPIASLTSAPSGHSNTTSLNISIGGADVVAYKYKVGSNSLDCGSGGYSSETPVSTSITDDISGESEGGIKVCVIGKDSTGNWKAEASATTASWTKDTVAPSITSLSDLGTINGATNVSASVTDASSISYSWSETSSNAGTVIMSAPSSSASDFSADQNDSYTVELTATDAAGNSSTDDFSFTWSTAWPSAVQTGAPTGESATTTLSIDIGGTDVTKYKYKIVSGTSGSDCGTDSTGYSSEVIEGTDITNDITSSPVIAEGSVVLCVVASDNIDNWQPYSSRSSVVWTKDTVAPVVDAGAAKVVNTSTAQDATVTESNTVDTYLWEKVSGPGSANFSNSAIEDPNINPDEGDYVLRLTVTDSAGNSGDDTVSFKMDVTAPTAGTTGHLTGTTATTSVTATVTGTDVQNYKHKLVASTGYCTSSSGYSASTPVGTQISEPDFSSLSDGTIKLCVVAEDSATNWQSYSSPTQVTWVKDTTAPTVGTISAFDTSSISDTSISVAWSKATDAIADDTSIAYVIKRSTSNNINNLSDFNSNGSSVGSGTDISGIVSGSLSEATQYYYNIKVTDPAGNTAVYSSSAQYTADLKTAGWDIGTAGDYTIASGATHSGSVISIDLVDQTENSNASFDGTLSNVSWNTDHLEQSSAASDGTYSSKIFDAGGDVDWDTITWTTEGPAGKSSPAASLAETTYASELQDRTDNVLNINFQETSAWQDTSTNGTTPSCGSCTSTSGQIGNAANFAGTYEMTVANRDDIKFTTEFTVSAWVTATGLERWSSIIGKSSDNGWTDGYGIYYDSPNLCAYTNTYNSNHVCTAMPATFGLTHVVATYQKSDKLRLYIDGVEMNNSTPNETITDSGEALRIGGSEANYYWVGDIDELSMWSGAFSAAEVLELYNRGTKNMTFQVRSCNDAACSGESFVGPDGTTGTYYSEALNSGAGLPSIDLSSASLATNRFFQYQAVFESLDSTEKALLKSVQVGPTHYNAGWPSVVNNTGITYDYLTSFAETTVGSGTIQYQISNDGSNWKYFNGVNWIAVGSDVNSNDASTINTNITSFASDIGTGTFYYKAFLISGGDGTLSLDLDDVQLGYATIQ